MQGALTCGQVEGQCNVLSCGVCQQIFPGHQHSQELHAHACAPDWEEVAIVVGLQETESGCFYLFVSETIKQIRNWGNFYRQQFGQSEADKQYPYVYMQFVSFVQVRAYVSGVEF